MKKILSLILTLGLMLGLCSVAQASVSIPLIGSTYEFGKYDNANVTALDLTKNKTVAHYFVTDLPLRRYTCRCPSYGDAKGSLTMSVYKWQGTYEQTIKSPPVASRTFVDFSDNSELSIYTNSFDCYGEILVLFHSPVQQVGVWQSNQAVNAGVTSNVYVGGKLTENVTLQAKYSIGDKIMVNDVERTARNAYNRIQTEDYDKLSRGFSQSDSTLWVNRTSTIAAYADINFGTTSPKGISMRVYPSGCAEESANIHIKIDDPENGQKIGEIYFEFGEQDSSWVTLNNNFTSTVTGTHDVYLVFDGYGYALDWFQFSKTTLPLTYYDERLANYKPVPDSELKNHMADTWSATDMMGRKLPGYETVGPKDEERQVGIFYWTWHATYGKLNATDIDNNEAVLKNYLRKNPGGKESDIKNIFTWTNADGTTGSWGDSLHWWNESIYGFYHGLDSWVMRKHMELLTAAEVDGLFFDTTNGTWTWTGGYMTLARVIHEMRQDGIKAPQISFILPFGANENSTISMRRIYQAMYGVGLYSDTWYYWDGKPVLMAYPDYLKVPTDYEDIDALNQEILEFFTFRPSQPSYTAGPQRADQWPWLESYPQHGFIPLTNSKYNYECVGVGIAQNANDNGLTAMNGEGVYGRSYTYKDRFSKLSEESKYYGYNFAEQWERAYELNPKMVFITGWNEWSVGHQQLWGGVEGAFADQYRDEYSRDIEPTKGDFKDNYYYQMIAGIRKFKGVNPTPVATDEKTIRMGGAFSQWDGVGPEFVGFAGGTEDREFYSMARKYYYHNTTGRNDIVLSKVARDTDNLYFYVKTKRDLTAHTDPSWMRLFINTDRTYKTGWEGYDFAVNIENPTASTSTTLSYTADGWNWQPVTNLTYKYSGNQMMIRVPRAALGLTDKIVDIEFKWIDNMQNQGDIMDVYNNGDSAPIGRFAYRYTETTDYDKTPVDEPVTVSDLKLNQYKHSVIMSIGKNTAFAGGKQKTLDTAPEIINGKTMIPLRFFSEGFGAEVKWNDATRTATVNLDGKTVNITVGKDTMDANGEEKALESPAVIKNGRTLVPMRDIAEALGKKVLWVDGGLIIAGENPETVHSYEWVGDMTEDNFGIR